MHFGYSQSPGVHTARPSSVIYNMLLGRQSPAAYIRTDFSEVFHHLSSVGPKQFCELAQLGCAREVDTS